MSRYIIYGAGAIGSIIGANLHRTGKEVVLVGRPAHAKAIQEEGLQLKVKGELHRVRLKAVSDISQLRPQNDDRLLVTLKTQQTAAAVESLKQAFPAEVPIVSLQNAVRNEEMLSTYFRAVYGGLVDISGTFLRPGSVEHTRNDLVAIGNFPRGFDSNADSISTDLEAAGFQVERSQDIMAIKWWKLILNANNALLAIVDCWLQKAVSDAEIYPLMADVLDESLRVVLEAGIQPQAPQGIPPIDAAIQKMRSGEMACRFDMPVEERTYPSTWQDLKLKRGETEVEFLNGEIERLGREHAIPTPLNSTLLRLVGEMSKKQEPPGKFRPRDIRRFFEEAQRTR